MASDSAGAFHDEYGSAMKPHTTVPNANDATAARTTPSSTRVSGACAPAAAFGADDDDVFDDDEGVLGDEPTVELRRVTAIGARN